MTSRRDIENATQDNTTEIWPDDMNPNAIIAIVVTVVLVVLMATAVFLCLCKVKQTNPRDVLEVIDRQ
jgi:hypothetical protein